LEADHADPDSVKCCLRDSEDPDYDYVYLLAKGSNIGSRYIKYSESTGILTFKDLVYRSHDDPDLGLYDSFSRVIKWAGSGLGYSEYELD